MELFKTLKISAAGMRAQSTRLRVAAENIANADSLPTAPGREPYRRKLLTFKNVFDRALDTNTVRVDKVHEDRRDFDRKYEPGHPAADAQGYVLTPNVKSLIEAMDLREAQRSYEANLSVIRSSKTMLIRTLDILRG